MYGWYMDNLWIIYGKYMVDIWIIYLFSPFFGGYHWYITDISLISPIFGAKLYIYIYILYMIYIVHKIPLTSTIAHQVVRSLLSRSHLRPPPWGVWGVLRNAQGIKQANKIGILSSQLKTFGSSVYQSMFSDLLTISHSTSWHILKPGSLS